MWFVLHVLTSMGGYVYHSITVIVAEAMYMYMDKRKRVWDQKKHQDGRWASPINDIPIWNGQLYRGHTHTGGAHTILLKIKNGF